jgi:serine/threonine protein kinase
MTITSQEWSGLTLAGGRYRVIAKLGEGGMGFVYRALDQNIDADVVIKVPRQAMMDDPEFAGRFTREIRSLVKLSHPHIVKVTDVGNYEGIPFAVMQYLAGGSLEDQRPVGPGGQVLPCDPRNICRWLIAVAEALDYIHTQGYVHRDVKPGNILFDTHGHAFLSDFGVAKVLASAKNPAPSQTAMTGAGMVLGTPEYMAPELIMGDQFDGRVDQYALAITVYELLCGRRPFEDETKTKVLVLHTSQTPSPLTAWCKTLPVRLSQAVLKGLAKDPSQRYADCAALAKAVAAAAENAVVQDERIRLKCPSCGKTGSIPVSDLARLKAGGGRATCLACRSPIDIGSAIQVAPGPTAGGTMKFALAPGGSGEYGLAAEQGPTVGGTVGFTPIGGSSGGHARPPSPLPERSGTMAMASTNRQTPPPIPGQDNPPPRSGSGTIIERSLPRPDEAAARNIFNTLDNAGPQGSGARKSEKRGADQTRIWIAVGAAAAAGLITTVGAALFFMPGSKKDTGSPPARLTTEADPQPPIKPQLSDNSSTPPRHETKKARLTKGSAPSKKSGGRPNQKTARGNQPRRKGAPEPSRANPELALNNQADATPISHSAPLPKAAKSAPPSVPTGIFATQKFDTARLARKPRSLDYPIQKVLERAASYRGEVVVPSGMYCLTRSGKDDGTGARKYVATECALQEVGMRKVLELTAHSSHELEIEPRLASKLDGLNRKFLASSLAILTLWVGDSGDCGVVRAEFLQKCLPRLKSGYGIGQADVEYYAFPMSAEESKPGKVPDEVWQRPGRMILFYNHWKQRVNAMRRMQQTADMAALTNVMGDMYKGAMRGAAVDAAQERARQGRISGR